VSDPGEAAWEAAMPLWAKAAMAVGNFVFMAVALVVLYGVWRLGYMIVDAAFTHRKVRRDALKNTEVIAALKRENDALLRKLAPVEPTFSFRDVEAPEKVAT
jgi:hypothetical protein